MGIGMYFGFVVLSISCGLLFAWYEKMRYSVHKVWTYHIIQWAMLTLWFWNAWAVGRFVYLEDTVFSKFGVSGGVFVVMGVAYVGFRKLLKVGNNPELIWQFAPDWANWLARDINGQIYFYQNEPNHLGTITGSDIEKHYMIGAPEARETIVAERLIERPRH